MKETEIFAIKGILKRTPDVLDALLKGIPEELAGCTEGAGTWSPFDVIGHLIHGERTDWIPRAEIILSVSTDKCFEPFERETMFETSKGKNIGELLLEFRELRIANLRKLEEFGITDEQLSQTGIHPEFGEVTLHQLLHTWAVHDLNHLAQIERVIAKQFDREVGPWKAYLRILETKQ